VNIQSADGNVTGGFAKGAKTKSSIVCQCEGKSSFKEGMDMREVSRRDFFSRLPLAGTIAFLPAFASRASAEPPPMWGQLFGENPNGDGVVGVSDNGGAGVRGIANGSNHVGVVGQSQNSGNGVLGVATNGDGVWGQSNDGGAGVRGIANGSNHDGVVGQSQNSGNGVLGLAANGSGVYAQSQGGGHGLFGLASYGNGSKITGGVDGLVASGVGVLGTSTSASVVGLVNPGGWHPETGLPNSQFSIGVCGAFSTTDTNPSGNALLPWDIAFVNNLAGSFPHIGVYGLANIGVLAVCPFSGGTALVATNTQGGKAAAFGGNVSVTGDLHLTGKVFPNGSDCAESFELAKAGSAEPGSVMVMDANGRLTVCAEEYDRRVAGVVSGAGEYKPGMVLGGDHTGNPKRAPIALVGRVFCKVDASFGSIAVGDLLTSSSTPGHARKVADAGRAFGAVLGKALRPLAEGRGLIPVLVALQ
jgi:hypothetical protein